MKSRIQKHIQLKEEANAIRLELIKEEQEYIKSKRLLNPGDVVEVWDAFENKFHAKGVIGGCKNHILIKLVTDDFAGLSEEEAIEKFKSPLIYEVFAMKKDGTASSKHMFQYPHGMTIEGESNRHDDYVIKIIK